MLKDIEKYLPQVHELPVRLQQLDHALAEMTVRLAEIPSDLSMKSRLEVYERHIQTHLTELSDKISLETEQMLKEKVSHS